MKIVEASVELVSELDAEKIMKHIELAGRVCYKSESKISDKSAEKFIANIIKSGHESVIEHVSLTFKIICDRGVTHEIFSQLQSIKYPLLQLRKRQIRQRVDFY